MGGGIIPARMKCNIYLYSRFIPHDISVEPDGTRYKLIYHLFLSLPFLCFGSVIIYYYYYYTDLGGVFLS